MKNQKLKTENFEIAENDFSNDMKWDDAIKYCNLLGNDWRLPNTDELYQMYNLKNKDF